MERQGNRPGARVALERAANAGEAIAMTNLAILLAEDGQAADALAWARKAVVVAPLYAHGYLVLGRLLLALHRPADALDALRHSLALEPGCATRYELGRALAAVGRVSDAKVELYVCLNDPAVRLLISKFLRELPP